MTAGRDERNSTAGIPFLFKVLLLKNMGTALVSGYHSQPADLFFPSPPAYLKLVGIPVYTILYRAFCYLLLTTDNFPVQTQTSLSCFPLLFLYCIKKQLSNPAVLTLILAAHPFVFLPGAQIRCVCTLGSLLSWVSTPSSASQLRSLCVSTSTLQWPQFSNTSFLNQPKYHFLNNFYSSLHALSRLGPTWHCWTWSWKYFS